MTSGFGGVISFGLRADDRKTGQSCAKLRAVAFAVSPPA